MEDRLHNMDHAYEAIALPKNLTYLENLSYAVSAIIDILKFLFLWLPVACKEFISLFTSVKLRDIKGHVAVVTGGGNGLGREICLELAARGCNVAVVDVNSEGLARTVKEINDSKLARAEGFKVDVSDADKVDELKNKVMENFGKVDILVNNAGVIPMTSLSEGSNQDIQRIIDVNLTAHFWTIRAFLPDMKKRRSGHLVTISSMLAVVVSGRPVSYNATKFGSRGLLLALAHELEDEGFDCIKTTCVYPYFIATRKDLYDGFSPPYPPVNPQNAAKIVVRAMRKNVREISVPEFLLLPGIFSCLLPYSLVRMGREHLMRATEFTAKWKNAGEGYWNKNTSKN